MLITIDLFGEGDLIVTAPKPVDEEPEIDDALIEEIMRRQPIPQVIPIVRDSRPST